MNEYRSSGATTNSYGSIQYTDPHSPPESGKRRRRSQLKHATRWPRAKPLSVSTKSAQDIKNEKRTLDRQVFQIFKQRYPGQQPKKGQLKVIREEILKNKAKSVKKVRKKTAPAHKHIASAITPPRIEKQNTIDKLARNLFARRHPGQKPSKEQLKDIRHEIVEGRKRLGL